MKKLVVFFLFGISHCFSQETHETFRRKTFQTRLPTSPMDEYDFVIKKILFTDDKSLQTTLFKEAQPLIIAIAAGIIPQLLSGFNCNSSKVFIIITALAYPLFRQFFINRFMNDDLSNNLDQIDILVQKCLSEKKISEDEILRILEDLNYVIQSKIFPNNPKTVLCNISKYVVVVLCTLLFFCYVLACNSNSALLTSALAALYFLYTQLMAYAVNPSENQLTKVLQIIKKLESYNE